MTSIEEIAAEHGLDCSAITQARSRSERRIALAREQLRDLADGVDDLIAFGSLARREATEQSDFDYLVVSTGLPSDTRIVTLLNKADHLRRDWAVREGHEIDAVPPPGASGLFGTAVSAFGVIDRIGLQEDTNHSLTRRMLLMEESISLMDVEVHERVLKATLERYLHTSGTRQNRPPRFLLNDILRYWHTVTVDYQAKARANRAGSSLRLVKLLIPRKLLYASSLMTMLLCGRDFGHQGIVDDLLKASQKPAFDRLLVAYDAAPDPVKEAMATLIRCQNQFLTWSSDGNWRTSMKRLTSDEADASLEFREAKHLANDVQRALQVIFFEWEELSDDSRRLLAF